MGSSDLIIERAQQRVAPSNGWKSRHGRSQSHVAWMAGGYGNVSIWSPSTKCR